MEFTLNILGNFRKVSKKFCLTSGHQFGYRVIIKSLVYNDVHYNNVTDIEWTDSGENTIITSSLHNEVVNIDLSYLIKSVTIKKAKKLNKLFKEEHFR